MAKTKKYPKMPKKGASLAVWENYNRKVKEIDSYNAKVKADERKKESLIAQAKKRVGR